MSHLLKELRIRITPDDTDGEETHTKKICISAGRIIEIISEVKKGMVGTASSTPRQAEVTKLVTYPSSRFEALPLPVLENIVRTISAADLYTLSQELRALLGIFMRMVFPWQQQQVDGLKHGELFGFMQHVVVGDDPAVIRGKPAPEIFLTAFNRFQEPSLETKNALVFKDAPTGVAAAIVAQMPVIMVLNS
ncbi:hypothetical protein R1flu_020405 [Riccia fluitans]|uniref:F-box domain-containing protein n=1 Tax=Riccia fluitans TaxID=41844 RepID=A0ABD1ZLE4_9MARC